MGYADNGTLVERLKAGDREALREAYEKYSRNVLALAAAMVGRRDRAWDILHDVFVSFARTARNLGPDSNVRAYLLTAAANRARAVLAERKVASLEAGSDDAAGELPSPSAIDPAAAAQAGEESLLLWNAVASLPIEQRTIVALHVYGGLTFREISARDGVSQNTAQSRYRYALENIRRKLREVEHGR